MISFVFDWIIHTFLIGAVLVIIYMLNGIRKRLTLKAA